MNHAYKIIVIFRYIINKILHYKTFQGEIHTGCDSFKCQGHTKQGKTEKQLEIGED